jgi:hypothetical protein
MSDKPVELCTHCRQPLPRGTTAGRSSTLPTCEICHERPAQTLRRSGADSVFACLQCLSPAEPMPAAQALRKARQ